MARISVDQLDDSTFRVSVSDRSDTTHTVTVSDGMHQKLTGGSVDKEVLLEASFRFLLKRESNTMILSSFDLPLIGQYFPEYEREMKKQFG